MIDEIWALVTLLIGFILWPICQRLVVPRVLDRIGYEKKVKKH